MLDAVLTNRPRVEAASSFVAAGESQSAAELTLVRAELDVVASALEVFLVVGRGAMRGRELPARPVQQLLEFLRKIAFGRAADRRARFPRSRRPTPERHEVFLTVLLKASADLSRADARRRFAHGARVVGELLAREVELERSAATAVALQPDCVCTTLRDASVHENRRPDPPEYERLLDDLVECTNYFVRAGTHNLRVKEQIVRLRALRAAAAGKSGPLDRPSWAIARAKSDEIGVDSPRRSAPPKIIHETALGA